MRTWRFQIGALLLSSLATAAGPDSAALFSDSAIPPVRFAATEIRKACAARATALEEGPVAAAKNSPAALRLVIATGTEQCARVAESFGVKPLARFTPQAYAIRRWKSGAASAVIVLGADPAGAMYGGLDVAEAVQLNRLPELREGDHAPYIPRRGIKFNIPLDLRTPSYSDNSHAAQMNIPEVWSFDFWRTFLDHMARHRFNVLTLWNLHPFPSLVRVPEFPDVALADVKRTLVPMDDSYSHSGSDMVRPALLARTETVKKMSIAEKIQFWRDVMQYAQDRGIEVYWFTWNIFTFGADGRYGITPEQDNLKTIDYFRASVRELVLTYPLLAGIGITAGEHMQDRQDEFSKEQWLWKTYGEGIRDALRRQPGRDLRLIHRYHMTSQDEIFKAWKDYPGTFELSFKYSIAHMYSIPNPPYIQPVLEHLPAGRKTWLTVRNDDIYSFRWGDPDYARAYLRHIPSADKIAGFYMGPDGYIWGREFLSREPETPRELVMEKQWFSFLLWGRLAYDPAIPNEHFGRVAQLRFPEVPSETLLAAWSAASKVFPLITRFFWGDIDVRWFPEACQSHWKHRGFYTVRDFIEGKTMPGSGVLSILEWRKRRLAGEPPAGTTPLDIAASLEQAASLALDTLPALRARQGNNKELRHTLGDIEAMAWLGRYYAAKIRGAADLALFDGTGKIAERDSALRHLRRAVDCWERYADIYAAQYEQPRLYNRVGWVNIPEAIAKVRRDVDMARQWKPGTVHDSQPGGHADQPFRK